MGTQDTPRKQLRGRGFTIFDLTLVVAATALGLAFVPVTQTAYQEGPAGVWQASRLLRQVAGNRVALPGIIAWFTGIAILALLPWQQPRSRSQTILWFGVAVALCGMIGAIAWFVTTPKASNQFRFIISGPVASFLVPPSLALIVAGLRRNRLRRALRRPGTIAGCAMLVSLIFSSLDWVLYRGRYALGWAPDADWFDANYVWEHEGRPGIAIAVAVAWSVLVLARRWRPEPTWVDRTGRVLGSFWIGTLVYQNDVWRWIA